MDFWNETTCGLKLLMEIYCNMSEAESFMRRWWCRVRSLQNTIFVHRYLDSKCQEALLVLLEKKSPGKPLAYKTAIYKGLLWRACLGQSCSESINE